jgi:hypothetical protein
MSTLAKQFEAFDQGRYIDSDGQESWCFNFYDWFCKDSSLKNKSDKLFRSARRFAMKKNIDMHKHYVFFKNNCPMMGPLYDDFRICEVETGDVVFTVTPKCGHTGMAEVWGKENDFKEPIFQGNTLNEYYK